MGGDWKGAHVAAWEYANDRSRPKGTEIDHECHNHALREGNCRPGPCPHRLCCNPRHLVLRANKREHMTATPGRDMRRHRGGSKLTDDQVRELRHLLATAQGDQMAEIGRRYGIGRTQAYRIKRGTSWAKLPDAA